MILDISDTSLWNPYSPTELKFLGQIQINSNSYVLEIQVSFDEKYLFLLDVLGLIEIYDISNKSNWNNNLLNSKVAKIDLQAGFIDQLKIIQNGNYLILFI